MKRRNEDRLNGRCKDKAPDLHTQYEELLNTVWRCERMARLEQRMEALARWEEQRERRWRGEK